MAEAIDVLFEVQRPARFFEWSRYQVLQSSVSKRPETKNRDRQGAELTHTDSARHNSARQASAAPHKNPFSRGVSLARRATKYE